MYVYKKEEGKDPSDKNTRTQKRYKKQNIPDAEQTQNRHRTYAEQTQGPDHQQSPRPD